MGGGGKRRARKARKKTSNVVMATKNAFGWRLQTTKNWDSIKSQMEEEVITPRFMRRKPMEQGTPMSSLARNASPTRSLSPTQRAQLDQDLLTKRFAAFRAKLAKPGPGAYDPKLTHQGFGYDMSVREGGKQMKSSAFASTLDLNKARNLELTYMGDPGSYDPKPVYTVQSMLNSWLQHQKLTTSPAGGSAADDKEKGKAAPRSPPKSPPKSHPPFGAQSARELRFPDDMNTAQPTGVCSPTKAYGGAGLTPTPGPLAYKPHQTVMGREHEMSTRYDGQGKRPTASFQSNVARIASQVPKSQEGMPGPGHYNSHMVAFDMLHQSQPGANMSSNLVSKVGRGRRFAGDAVISEGDASSQTGPKIGPGAYSPSKTNDGTRSTIGARVHALAAGQQDASFASNAKRDLNSWFLDELGC